MSDNESCDCEELRWLMEIAFARIQVSGAAGLSQALGIAFGVIAWIQLVLSTAPGQTLADEEFVADVMGGLWLLIGLIAMFWVTAWSEHRRLKVDYQDCQNRAAKAGYGLDGRTIGPLR